MQCSAHLYLARCDQPIVASHWPRLIIAPTRNIPVRCLKMPSQYRARKENLTIQSALYICRLWSCLALLFMATAAQTRPSISSSTQLYPVLPNSTKQYPTLPNSTQQCQAVPKSTHLYQHYLEVTSRTQLYSWHCLGFLEPSGCHSLSPLYIRCPNIQMHSAVCCTTLSEITC